jgi:flagellar biosynthesis protein FliR
VIASANAFVLMALLVFCRVGACLMLLPALSGARMPVRIRLFLALAISLALLPLLADAVRPALVGTTLSGLVGSIGIELIIGASIGLLARIFFLALQTLGVAISQLIGITMAAGAPIDEPEQVPEIATILGLTATTLLFITDQHWELLRGIVESYGRLPAGQMITAQASLTGALDQLAAAFLVALRVASPFLIYSVVVNFAVGITNKLTPQIPVYFIATPFITAGGLLLFYMTANELMIGFMTAFIDWLKTG